MLANLTTASSGSPSLDSTRSDEQNLYLRGVGTSSASTRLKDEAILAKLAVMNKSWFKKNTDEATDVFNVDSRPGSAIATTRCSSYTNKGLSPSHQKGTRYFLWSLFLFVFFGKKNSLEKIGCHL